MSSRELINVFIYNGLTDAFDLPLFSYIRVTANIDRESSSNGRVAFAIPAVRIFPGVGAESAAKHPLV